MHDGGSNRLDRESQSPPRLRHFGGLQGPLLQVLDVTPMQSLHRGSTPVSLDRGQRGVHNCLVGPSPFGFCLPLQSQHMFLD